MGEWVRVRKRMKCAVSDLKYEPQTRKRMKFSVFDLVEHPMLSQCCLCRLYVFWRGTHHIVHNLEHQRVERPPAKQHKEKQPQQVKTQRSSLIHGWVQICTQISPGMSNPKGQNYSANGCGCERRRLAHEVCRVALFPINGCRFVLYLASAAWRRRGIT